MSEDKEKPNEIILPGEKKPSGKVVPVRGESYPHRAALKRMGGKWSDDEQCWLIPADKAAEAKRLTGDDD